MKLDLKRRLAAECLGTAGLLAAVVGSGIMAERLAGGNVALALLANTIATGAALFALILIFAPLSGAHFNPAVTVCEAWIKNIPWRDAALYIPAQIAGAIVGVAAANLMFGLPVLFASNRVRTGWAQWFSEALATFGLLAVIRGCSRLRSLFAAPLAVAAYITAAYWFTASTSFANPAVAIARSLTNTFSGIRPVDLPGFIVAEILGALLASWLLMEARNPQSLTETEPAP